MAVNGNAALLTQECNPAVLKNGISRGVAHGVILLEITNRSVSAGAVCNRDLLNRVEHAGQDCGLHQCTQVRWRGLQVNRLGASHKATGHLTFALPLLLISLAGF